jgi:hypothetical protein
MSSETQSLGTRMRHRGPGNGSIYGPNAEVCSETFLSRDSAVFGDTDIVDSVVRSSRVYDSRLYGAVVEGSYIERCRVFRASVERSTLSGLTVLGGADVVGVCVHAPGLRIDRGEWLARMPAFAYIGERNQPDDEPGIKVLISECVENRFHIGCWCLTYQDWTREGYRERLGKSAGWTPSQIEFAYDTFTDWRLLRAAESQ